MTNCKARSGTAVWCLKGGKKHVVGENSPLCVTASGAVVDRSVFIARRDIGGGNIIFIGPGIKNEATAVSSA